MLQSGHRTCALQRGSTHRIAGREPIVVRSTQPSKKGSSPASSTQEVYLGFEKTDYDRSNGRKGRVIKDDVRKYPNKEDLGFFLGATGGWAGGEQAIVKIKEEVQANKPAPSSPIRRVQKTDSLKASKGKEVLYLGYNKDELEVRKSGAKGRLLVDDPTKYPGKDDIGPLLGATGGFAGGEAGLGQYLKIGEVKLRKPGDAGQTQSTPLLSAFGLAIFGAGGGALLSQVVNANQVNVDAKVFSLLLSALVGAIGVAAAGALLLGSRAMPNPPKPRP